MILEAGVYEIPDDCTAIYYKRKVYVHKMALKRDGRCCKKCIHQKWGDKCMRGYETYYCDAHPKIIGGVAGYFYNATPNKPACKDFEPNPNYKELKDNE